MRTPWPIPRHAIRAAVRAGTRHLVAATVALAATAATQAAAPAVRLPDPVYEIRLEVSYDPASGSLSGREHLRWHNTSSAPVPDLQLHLYLNAFASNRSTFMKERGTSRGRKLADGQWGFMEVVSLTLADGTDLKPAERFLHPDDDNAEDRTVASYPLPRPLPPGEWLEADIRFVAQLPGDVARTCRAGDYVLAGQWFPKVGVWQDAGTASRAAASWNCHQYHADSEFFADFGDYDVTITLPARYRGHVGGTGKLVEVRGEEATVRVRFVQQGVHDFAWAADPRFVELKDRFRPAYDVPLGMRGRVAAELGVGPGELDLQPVEMTLLVQPANLQQAGRYLAGAKAALAVYGLRLGPYPWATMTMVDPPRNARGSGGMEYETFITLGTHPFRAIPPLDGWKRAEVVAAHEVGHNYWQGQIASNEFEEPWLDEGINTYYEALVMDPVFGGAGELLGARLSSEEQSHGALVGEVPSDPIATPAWGFLNGNAYFQHTYFRPAAVLVQLERELGREVFARTMRRFFTTWRFRHATTADFEKALTEASGRDISGFLAQAFHGTVSLDFAVRSARSARVKERAGYFWEGGVRRLVEPAGEHGGTEEKPGARGEEKSGAQGEEKPGARGEEKSGAQGEEKPGARGEEKPGARGEEKSGAQGEEPYRTVVVVERRGEFRHPVTVELTFEDGAKERRQWDGAARWARFEVLRAARLARVDVDPDGVVFLDCNRVNNSLLLEPRRAPARKMLAHLMFWLQGVLSLAAVLG